MDFTNIQSTPVQKLKDDYHGNSLYMKRDDLFPVSFGGNKARKAIFFFKDYKSSDSDCIVTYGSSSSNHCRVIANIAASEQIPCHIISPSESSHTTSNSQLVDLFGANVTTCPVTKVNETINKKIDQLRLQGHRPYFIQGGGHGNLGTESYKDAFNEILNYEKLNSIYFDYIFLTSGTGTTQAGLICGSVLNNDNKKIIGISNARKNPYGGQVVLNSVNDYLIKENRKVLLDMIYFNDEYILEGYGAYNEEILKTIKNILISDGIPLDVVYTGKAFWGMKEYIKKHKVINKKILFVHTGGTPLFFDKLEDLKNEQ